MQRRREVQRSLTTLKFTMGEEIWNMTELLISLRAVSSMYANALSWPLIYNGKTGLNKTKEEAVKYNSERL